MYNIIVHFYRDNRARDDWIRQYFHEGYLYSEIRGLLLERHSMELSTRQVRRILKRQGLQRRNQTSSPLEDIVLALLEELDESGSCLGYKSMWYRLRTTYGLQLRRDSVLKLLRIADPAGVEARSRRRLRRRKYVVPGPNFLWHVDGYDKLKPFGFAIHGGVDGFSRKILWLEVAASNNNPLIISHYYLKAVQKLGLLPTIIRSDKGTENCGIQSLQQCFRMDHDDKLSGFNSFIQGRSTSNQRIESYWCQMRKQGMNFWISLFKDFRDNSIFDDSNPLHMEALKFCFGSLIKYDLESIRKDWNRHSIRKQKNTESPPGKPNYLYYCPADNGVKDYRKPVNQRVVDACLSRHTIEPHLCSPDFIELVELLFPKLDYPTIIDDWMILFAKLIDSIDQLSDDD